MTTKLILLFTLALPACSSVNNLSGAKTMANEQYQVFTGLSYGHLRRERELDDAAMPALDLAFRYGVTDKDEAMIKVTSNFTSYALDYKRALVEGPFFYLSTGLGLGIYKDNFISGVDPIYGTDLSIPLYAEYFVTEQTSILMGARLVRSVVYEKRRSDFGSIMLTTGFRSGQKYGLHFELGYGKANTNRVPDLWQLSAGFYF
jgi:hypothetical protein